MSPLRLLLSALVIIGVLTRPAFADSDAVTSTGNELIQYCSQSHADAQDYAWAVCLSYISGEEHGIYLGLLTAMSSIAAAYPKLKKADVLNNVYILQQFCIPSNVTRGQMALVVAKYLKDHPESLNQHEATLVWAAMREAWPYQGGKCDSLETK